MVIVDETGDRAYRKNVRVFKQISSAHRARFSMRLLTVALFFSNVITCCRLDIHSAHAYGYVRLCVACRASHSTRLPVLWDLATQDMLDPLAPPASPSARRASGQTPRSGWRPGRRGGRTAWPGVNRKGVNRGGVNRKGVKTGR